MKFPQGLDMKMKSFKDRRRGRRLMIRLAITLIRSTLRFESQKCASKSKLSKFIRQAA
jgi:hypothetical protein